METYIKFRCGDFRDLWAEVADHSAQLVLTDIQYCLGKNAYGSNPQYHQGHADQPFFALDFTFDIQAYIHAATRAIRPDGAVFTFCAFEQMAALIEAGNAEGLKKHLPFVFIKKTPASFLKCRMASVQACEFGLLQYFNRLPKFHADGHIRKNWIEWDRNPGMAKIHPTQKPISVLSEIMDRYTEPGDLVVDFCAGSGSTLRAAHLMDRNAIGMEIDPKFYNLAKFDLELSGFVLV